MPVARYLKRYGYQTVLVPAKEMKMEMIADFDLIVLQMVFDRRLIKEIKKQKKKYIFEMDDLLTWVPKDHYAHKEIKQSGWEWRLAVWNAIRKADAITTTNKHLARYYRFLRPIKNNIHVLPNYIDEQFWLKDHKKNLTDTIRIGYVGGMSHVEDLKTIVNPLKRILKEFPNTRFIQMGTGGWSSDDDEYTEFNYGDDVFKQLPRNQRTYYHGASMMVYPDKLYALQLDIGIAPLIENRFTKSKTPIKWMEYALNRTPSVCQEFLYKDVVKHGENGYLATTEDDYYKYLKLLVKDKSARLKIGERAYWDTVSNYVFSKHGEKWRRVYDKILNS